ncbi:MAG: D-cysteine desulfhydrase [Pseudomonadota bacterium]
MSISADVLEPATSIDFDRFPQVRLCHRPTPIEPMPRLSDALGGPQLFIKRDDCTGLATGGNKTRKLEFLLGEALQEGADILVTHGAVQSNHVRQTAAAACRAGLKCHALLEERVQDAPAGYQNSGNVLLDKLFGTTLEYRPPGLDMNAETEVVAQKLRDAGHRPYFIPGGGSNATGALGYARCAQEIVEQSGGDAPSFDWLVTATGSTGTHAGLLAGLHGLGSGLPVMGISVRQPEDRQIAVVHGLAKKTVAKLGLPDIPASKVLVDDGYIGEGYGIPADSTIEAIEMAAETEGILLDPVYSAKGMAGLIGLVREGFFKPADNVLFLHTGGAIALFAYEELVLRSKS